MTKKKPSLKDKIVDDFFDNPGKFAELNQKMKEQILTEKYLDEIAKAVTHFAFRNGPVEDMHSDGKLTQNDMKTLNKFMFDRLAYVFKLVIEEKWAEFAFLIDSHRLYGSDWDPAEPDSGDARTLLKLIAENDFKWF